MYGKLRFFNFFKFLVSIFVVLALLLTISGCKTQKTVTVAACETPHTAILKKCAPTLAERGYKLVVREIDNYTTPNFLLESGEVDANFFQHQPFLDEFNVLEETNIVSVARVHYEPYAIYAGCCDSLSDLSDGAKIAVPNDPTNEARALRLLEDCGLITLRDGAGLKANKNDIEKNTKNFNIVELEASVIPNALDEVAVAVINGNYAIASGLEIADALAIDGADSAAAVTYANVLAVKTENKDDEAILVLAEALQSDEVKEYINSTYGGSAVAVE